MHTDELWQEYDFNGNRLGGIDSSNFEPNSVKLFGGVAIMLYRFREEKVEFLFQHRSKFVDHNPEKWDVSAGGHINFEESILDAAVRETAEEIGAKIEREKLEFSATYVRRGSLYINLYFYDWTGKEDDFHFDDKEVSEVKWVAFEDLTQFWSNLKPSVYDDAIFQHQLLEWTRLARQKYGNLDK